MSTTVPQHILTKQDLKEVYCISDYMTEAERAIYLSDYDPNQAEFGFVPKRMQSKYVRQGGSKSGNTELRIAGSILHLVNAMLSRAGHGRKECRVSFTKDDLARMVHDGAGKGISKRTVQEYLSTVLDKLQEIYGLHYEIINGRNGGIQVWTDALELLEQGGQREFDTSLIRKTKSDSMRAKLVEIQKEREKKRSTLNYFKAKGSINKRAYARMIRLAHGWLKGREVEVYSQLSPERNHYARLMTPRLIQGASLGDAYKDAVWAIRETNTQIVLGSVSNSMAYAKKVLASRPVIKKGRRDFMAERYAYWQSHYDNAMQSVRVETEKGNDFASTLNANIAQRYFAKMQECKP